MTSLYGFLARLSGFAAGLCAVLVLMAAPSAKADDVDDCIAACLLEFGDGPGYAPCAEACSQTSGCATSTCQNPCGPNEVQGGCIAGQCNKTPACVTAKCKCVLKNLGKSSFCECDP